MNGTNDFDAHATRSFYDRISSAYDLISDAGEGAARNKGIELLNLQPGEKVLDIGYGTGSAAIELAKRVGPSGQVWGIDISPGMNRVAEKKVQEAGLATTVKLEVGSALKLPYDDNAFDAVYMSFTLELFPEDDIVATLAEAKRVLHPGGRLAVVAMATVRGIGAGQHAGKDLQMDPPPFSAHRRLPPDRRRKIHRRRRFQNQHG